MPSERAVRLAESIGRVDPLTGTRHFVTEAVAEALDAERLAGMEAAAEVEMAEVFDAVLSADWIAGHYHAVVSMRQAIRAAIAKEKAKG